MHAIYNMCHKYTTTTYSGMFRIDIFGAFKILSDQHIISRCYGGLYRTDSFVHLKISIT